jgi:hypothetical protein
MTDNYQWKVSVNLSNWYPICDTFVSFYPVMTGNVQFSYLELETVLAEKSAFLRNSQILLTQGYVRLVILFSVLLLTSNLCEMEGDRVSYHSSSRDDNLSSARKMSFVRNGDLPVDRSGQHRFRNIVKKPRLGLQKTRNSASGKTGKVHHVWG